MLEALRDLGGEAAPAAVASTAGVAPRTLTRDLDWLASAGLVGGTKQRRRLTAAGWERLGADVLPVPATAFDDAVQEVFGPDPYHAALVRLVADAVVARQLGPDWGWAPSFAACGPPATGKTAAAQFVVWGFGFDRLQTIRDVPGLAAGEVIGRRRQLPGGGYTVERSPLVDQPFVCLDEWADDPAVRREALRLVYGDTAAMVEGERVELRPTVLLTYNTTAGKDPRWPLPEKYWRRCLVAHLDRSTADGGLSHRLNRFFAERRPPALRVDAMRWPGDRLPDNIRRFVDQRAPFRAVMSEPGRLRYGDVRSVEALALGRIARLGVDLDVSEAVVLHVVHDLCTIAETIDGHIDPGWRLDADKVRRTLAGKPGVCELAEAVEARIRGRNARAAAAGQVRYTQQVESLARVGRRAELAGRFSTAARSIERVPVEHRPRAAGLRAQLRTLAAKAAEARSDDALDDLEHLGEPVVTEAQALRQVLDEAAAVDKLRRRQQADEQKRAAEQRRRIERSDKVAADQHRRAAAAAEKAREKRARDLRGLLARKTTRPGEDVLGRLVALDVVRRVDRAERVDTRNGWDRLTGQAPRWMRRPIVGYETVEGSWHRAEALASWQAPAVRAALQEALAVLDRPAPVLSQAQAALLPAPAIRAAPASGAPPGTAAALYGRLRP